MQAEAAGSLSEMAEALLLDAALENIPYGFCVWSPQFRLVMWNKRYRDNMMRIRSGDINEVSCVLFSLMKREHDKGLSTGERKMLISARQIFVSEISLSVGRSRDEIEELLADVFE